MLGNCRPVLHIIILGLFVHLASADSQIVAKGWNNFGFNLYRQLRSKLGSNKNVILSPISAALALGMVQQGAKGETQEELNVALGMSDLAPDTIAKSYKEIMVQIQGVNATNTLKVANGAFIQESFPVLNSYKQNLKDEFSAEIHSSDFLNDSVRVTEGINSWVLRETNGLIPKLFFEPLPTSTVLVLINAILFSGKWELQFNAKRTRQEPFYFSKEPTLVDMMRLSETIRVGHDASLNVDVLELFYTGQDLSMVILLPRERTRDLSDLEQQLTAATFQSLLAKTFRQKIVFKMPKFRFESSLELNDVLQQMGVAAIFRDDANLSGITQARKLKVSDVIQKAVVEVTEEGTKAAAVTAVRISLVSASVSSPKPREITVDHPFLFVIRHVHTGLVLFVGRVSSPK